MSESFTAAALERLARGLCMLDCRDPDFRRDGMPAWEFYAQEASRALDALSLINQPQPDLFPKDK